MIPLSEWKPSILWCKREIVKRHLSLSSMSQWLGNGEDGGTGLRHAQSRRKVQRWFAACPSCRKVQRWFAACPKSQKGAEVVLGYWFWGDVFRYVFGSSVYASPVFTVAKNGQVVQHFFLSLIYFLQSLHPQTFMHEKQSFAYILIKYFRKLLLQFF